MDYNKKSVEDIDVAGKKVIVRCDFNVPQDETGRITDDKRIVAALPTIRYLLEHQAAVMLPPGSSEGRIQKEVYAGSGSGAPERTAWAERRAGEGCDRSGRQAACIRTQAR